MARKRRVALAESAVRDLEEIRDWYIGQLVSETGDRLIREVFSRIERLSDFPESGRVVPEFNLENLREIVDPPFRKVYRLDQERIRIVRVWRSERVLEV
jgi:toxin ParE1/3/4